MSDLTAASPFCQRWRDRQHSWRHTSEGGFDRAAFEVAPLAEAEAKAFVQRHHYSGTYPVASRRYGLWRGAELQGVAVLSVPVQKAVLTGVFPDLQPYAEALELGRFVLLDAAPANTETWFLTRAFELAARDGIRGVVSFSDPEPRQRADGTLAFRGHVGTIYQAANAAYTGRGRARTIHLLPDGRTLNARTIEKIRTGDRGHLYAEAQLVELGARPRGRDEDRGAWLAEAIAAAGIRQQRHAGCLRYAFTLGADRRARRAVRLALPSLPYVKADQVGQAA